MLWKYLAISTVWLHELINNKISERHFDSRALFSTFFLAYILNIHDINI